MPASLVQGDSLLAVDVGAATTRAVLFDVVEGEYRFLASSSAPSTAEAPFRDVIEGVRDAITNLQSVTGRNLPTGTGSGNVHGSLGLKGLPGQKIRKANKDGYGFVRGMRGSAGPGDLDRVV